MSELGKFINIVKSYYQIKDEESLKSLLASKKQEILSWVSRFDEDIHNSHRGYPRGEVMESPLLEERLKLIVQDNMDLLTAYEDKPTLCLTHDLDYLSPTWALKFKTLVGRKKWLGGLRPQQFLDSIKMYLDLENELFSGNVKSTFFIPSVKRSKSLRARVVQSIIDPSYRVESDEFSQLKDLIKEYKPDVGLHGSYFSTEEAGEFTQEKTMLEEALQCSVNMARQHWLHLPNKSSLKVLADAGIRYDSTLGWNGKMGFRCGLSRPFALDFGENSLIEIPLLIMDGVLFDELNLSEDEAFALCVHYLNLVFAAKGTVAINWHGRTYSTPYYWGDLYKRLLEWAIQKGFQFDGIQAVGAGYRNRVLGG